MCLFTVTKIRQNSYLQCFTIALFRYIYLNKSAFLGTVYIIIGIHFQTKKDFIMPYNFEYPIDDNTLFILLALRYQGCIKRENIYYAYDKSVNYDYTYIKHNNNREAVTSIREKGVDWINNEFGLVEANNNGGEPILRVEKEEKLRDFLNEYFSEFRTYEDYYYSIDEHKKTLVDFIETNFAGRKNEELGKKFTYKFTPDEQYKMIQYIGYLIHLKIFAEPIDEREMFTFNNGEKGYKKAVRMRFADGYNIESFKRGRKNKGMFYIYTDGDTNIYYALTNAPIHLSSDDMHAVLWKCIAENLNEITIKFFRAVRKELGKNTREISDYRIGKYFPKCNENLQDITGLNDREFIYNPHRDGVWIVDLG